MTHPDATSPATVELVLTGMHCGSCVALIEEVLTDESGVVSATVDLDSAKARVTYHPEALTVEDLCAVVVATGYGATQLSAADNP